MHCEQTGSGPDVVLLHGWGWHGDVWRDVASALARRFHVWVPDLPGHGESRDGATDGTLSDVVQALRERVPADAAWVGWSLGGSIALAAARDGLVRRLVLVGATPCFVQRPGWDHGWSSEWFERFSAEFEQDPGAALNRFASLHPGTAVDRPLLRRLRAELARHAPPSPAGLRILKQTDLRPALGAITVPARVLHGAGDQIVPPRAGELLAQSLANGQFVSIAGAGHALPLSHSEVIVDAVTECFLE